MRQPPATAGCARRAHHETRDALLHQGTLRGREGVEHVLPRSDEGAHVAWLRPALQRRARLGRRVARIHRHRRLLVGKENPVPCLLRQRAPRHVHVVTHRDEDVTLVLPLPRRRPRCDGTLTDRERVIRHHQLLRDVVHRAQAVTPGACPLRRVGREILGVQHPLSRRIGAGARVQHAQQVGDRGHAAH